MLGFVRLIELLVIKGLSEAGFFVYVVYVFPYLVSLVRCHPS